MRLIRGMVLAGAALVTTVSNLQAADLYGGYGGRGSIKDGYVAPARGCPTWYGRVDFGYAAYDRPAISQVGIDDHLRTSIDDSWSLGGGIGRYFTCQLRGDITVDHRFESNVHSFNGNVFSPTYGSQSWGFSSTAVLANIYYDFDLRSRFTPYIGFGFGAVYDQFTRGRGVVGPANAALAGNPISVQGGDRWNMAAAVMTGFTFALRDRLSLDAGYRFLYLGKNSTGQITEVNFGGTGGPATVDQLHVHELRLGLRYDIQ
jgi:opacity protein-like surface antigen